jgi:RAB protein geranylgeranyltransferase component A
VEPDAVLDIDADKKPLHTVDYFVSQGIKVDLSAMPQDKLTTHLRKFTDWLKQVKTANNNPQDLGTNLEMEKAVAETAKNSNETREIVTESMADVLVKQGQADKAIQLYIKLSFLNPEKSSYFAAKIEQLKGI